MELVITEERAELRTALRRFFADKSPSTQVRRLMDTADGYDPALWRQMGLQLGLQGLAIPEEYGGAGFGFQELVIVLEEMGRVLLWSPAELPEVASLAKAYCSDAYVHAAAETIQIHGGIGFTWEHDAHLYFKRAKSAQLFLGDPAHHRARLADRLGL